MEDIIMGIRKFLTSVADVYAYDADDNIVFTSKTLLDSSIEVTLGSAPVRGGRGNQLQYTYYHTGEFNVTLTDTQWNLALLGSTVGDTQTALYDYYKEETVTMSGSSASVTGTPLAFEGETIYGWATSPSGATQKVTFTGKTFTVSDSVAGDWCVRYYTENATSGNAITISANMVPKVVKLVMETQLNSADVTTNKIGMVQIIIPRLQLSGAFSISMTADGIANTPLTGTALAFSDAASQSCGVSEGYYARIIEVIDNTSWYDNLIGLAIEGGNITMGNSSTETLSVFAIPSSGTAFKVPNSAVCFTSSSPTVFNVTGSALNDPAPGIVTSSSATDGTGKLSIYLFASGSVAPTGEATVTVA